MQFFVVHAVDGNSRKPLRAAPNQSKYENSKCNSKRYVQDWRRSAGAPAGFRHDATHRRRHLGGAERPSGSDPRSETGAGTRGELYRYRPFVRARRERATDRGAPVYGSEDTDDWDK